MTQNEDLVLREDFGKMESELEVVEAEILTPQESHKILRIEIDKGLEESLQELQKLKDKLPKEQTQKLFDQCTNNALEAVVGHFGLASAVLGAQDGGNVTTTHNFKKGITATAEDKAKYEVFEQGYDRKNSNYDKIKDQKRDQAPKEVTSEYNGQTMERGKGAGKAQLDHVVSVNEMDRDPRFHLFLDEQIRAETINSDDNLKWLEASANASKNNKDLMSWGNEIDPQTGKTNFEKYDIDPKKAQEIYDKAKKTIANTINKEQFKKQGKEVLLTGAKDAAKMAVYSAIGIILKDFISGMMIELKILFKEFGNESLKEIFTRFKNRLFKIWEDLKVKWKDIIAGSVEAGVCAFFSNLIVFAVNIVFTTLKSIVRIIRAGFNSLYQAVKIIINPPKDMPQEDVMFEASKIFVTGIIGAVAMLSSETIHTWLKAIPGLNVILALPIPFSNETIGDALSLCISAAMGAVLSTIAIYYMDKYATQNKEDLLQVQIMAKSGEIVQYQIARSWFMLGDAFGYFERMVERTTNVLGETKLRVKQSSLEVEGSLEEVDDMLNQLKLISKINRNKE